MHKCKNNPSTAARKSFFSQIVKGRFGNDEKFTYEKKNKQNCK